MARRETDSERTRRAREREAVLAVALRAIIDRHDKQADEDVPPIREEDGHMTCGCVDCQTAKDALERVGRGY